jgi:hypothetical protein
LPALQPEEEEDAAITRPRRRCRPRPALSRHPPSPPLASALPPPHPIVTVRHLCLPPSLAARHRPRHHCCSCLLVLRFSPPRRPPPSSRRHRRRRCIARRLHVRIKRCITSFIIDEGKHLEQIVNSFLH